MTQQDPQIDFNIVDEETLQTEKEKYIRELKLHEMFADAPEELKNIVDEAKKEPMDDLIYQQPKSADTDDNA